MCVAFSVVLANQNLEARENEALAIKPQWFVQSLGQHVADIGAVGATTHRGSAARTADDRDVLGSVDHNTNPFSDSTTTRSGPFHMAQSVSDTTASSGTGMSGTFHGHGSDTHLWHTQAWHEMQDGIACFIQPEDLELGQFARTIEDDDLSINSSILVQSENGRSRSKSVSALDSLKRANTVTLRGSMFKDPVAAQSLHASAFATQEEYQEVVRLIRLRHHVQHANINEFLGVSTMEDQTTGMWSMLLVWRMYDMHLAAFLQQHAPEGKVSEDLNKITVRAATGIVDALRYLHMICVLPHGAIDISDMYVSLPPMAKEINDVVANFVVKVGGLGLPGAARDDSQQTQQQVALDIPTTKQVSASASLPNQRVGLGFISSPPQEKPPRKRRSRRRKGVLQLLETRAFCSGKKGAEARAEYVAPEELAPPSTDYIQIVPMRQRQMFADVYAVAIVLWQVFTWCEVEPYTHLSGAGMSKLEIVRNVAFNSFRPSQTGFVKYTPGHIIRAINDCWDGNPHRRPKADELYRRITPK